VNRNHKNLSVLAFQAEYSACYRNSSPPAPLLNREGSNLDGFLVFSPPLMLEEGVRGLGELTFAVIITTCKAKGKIFRLLVLKDEEKKDS